MQQCLPQRAVNVRHAESEKTREPGVEPGAAPLPPPGAQHPPTLSVGMFLEFHLFFLVLDDAFHLVKA